MDKSKIKLFITFIIFSIILSLASITADAFFFGNTAQKVALQNAVKKTEEREAVLQRFLEQSKNTLRAISTTKLFEEYLNEDVESSTIEELFVSHAKSQANFMQLRYIDKNGQEKIRVDRYIEKGAVHLISKEKLQNKSKRYYFADSKTKELEKVWFSALDLNVEYNKVEKPFNPTLRAIYPIKHNDQFAGIIIINYFMQDILAKLLRAPLYDMILCDSNGFTLTHYQKEKSWGFHVPEKYNISLDFPNSYQQILSSKVYISNEFVSRKLELPLDNELYLILQLKQSYLEQQQQTQNEQNILVISIIFLFSLVLSIFIVRKFSTTILNLEEIKELNENLNRASKIAKIGFFEYFPSDKYIQWSPGVYNLFNIDSHDRINTQEKFLTFIPDEDKKKMLQTWQESIEKKDDFFSIHTLQTKHSLKIVEQRAKHYYDKNGIHIKSLGSIYDTTQSFQQQELLGSINRELEETNDELETSLENLSELHRNIQEEKIKYKNILDFASDGIHIIDNKGGILECSYSFAKMLGYTIEELYLLNIKDIDIQGENDIFHMLSSLKFQPSTFETQYRKKDKSLIDVQTNAKRIEIDGEKYIYLSARDITEQKKAQKKIKEQKNEFEAVFNYSKEGIAITDLEANFLTFNDAYLKMTGFDEEELLTMNCKDLTIDEDKEKNEATFHAVMEYGFIENFEKRCMVKDGKQLSVMMTISLLPDKKRLLLVTKDMTSLKLLEEQSKLASMGEMIGNIAHQWRQPLSIITTSASGLDLKADMGEVSKEEIQSFAAMVIDQSNYLSKTIDDFKNFIKGDIHYSKTSIKEMITETLRLTDASIKGNFIKVILDIDKDLTVLGNKNELEQALINILNNAKDALKEISDKKQERYIFISTKQLDANTLVLEVLDNAGGIDEKVIHRIFEPYFTTKHKSLGTGLGLSMTDKIIRQRHKGNIKVVNKEYEYENIRYKGACFTLTFHNKEDTHTL